MLREQKGGLEPSLSMNPRIERDRQMLLDAKGRGRGATAAVFVRLSGPGWLQSAITLGGGTLASSLYLGVLGGFMFLWLQPVAMVAGIVMLSAIAYVTLSTGERPLRAINRHVNPALGWGWLLASMAANIVWSLPQFALATASFQQNLFPGIVGEHGIVPAPYNSILVGLAILCLAVSAGTLYLLGGKGMRVFEIVVKCLVGTTVACFMATVITLTLKGSLHWREIASGLLPRLNLLFEPAPSLMAHIREVPEQFQSYWSGLVVSGQRDVMISAGAAAVGINMTFMFPYSMLRKGWDRDFRGLAIFDLATGLFFPFLLATSCVIIASAGQFHAKPAQGFVALEGQTVNAQGQVVGADGRVVEPALNLVANYESLLKGRLARGMGADAVAALSEGGLKKCIGALPEADRRVAAMLVTRDAFNLKDAIAPLVGGRIANYVFGLGVLGMGMGAATMLMLINGLCLCEALNRPARGRVQFLGMAMVWVGILGPFLWQGPAKMWLAIPTSVFAMALLPAAYFSFFLLMNQKSFLGDDIPRGLSRVVWNVLLFFSATLAAIGALYSIYAKLGAAWGTGILLVAAVALGLGHLHRKKALAEEAG